LSSQSKLSIHNLSKSFDELIALDKCSFEVEEGSVVSIVGPSGCGKTTLLWSISGLITPSAGKILLDEEEIKGPKEKIGLVFQESNLLPWRNLIENIYFPFEIKRIKPDKDWVDHLLERVGLVDFKFKFPNELSGGMQQRASIVRALSLRPSVLLMDEPFGALDAFTREEMNKLVEEIWLETKTTIVFVTHSIQEAIFLSDRVMVMTNRPGTIKVSYGIDFDYPREPKILTTPKAIELTNSIKSAIFSRD